MTTAGSAEGQRSAADRLGVTAGMVVSEIGRDDDSDAETLAAIVERTGVEPVGEDSDDVVDMVLLWFREDDGDLVDALMDARVRLADNTQTSTVSVSKDWTGAKLTVPKGQRAPRR